jgi:uncharacterized membrane protein YdfJ with MMPL/SSD domain
MDQPRSLRDHLPLGLAILCATTLVILFLMTGSVLLPIKALIMNLLTSARRSACTGASG